MKKAATAEADIVIIGGGVAGLWLLNKVRSLGFVAVLLEAETLGGGQTFLSQGIIHGGMKYALQGVLTDAAQSIADMPRVWNECLKGKGELDLTKVPILSQHQYMWSTGSLTSKLTGFFSSLMLKANVKALSNEESPDIFHTSYFKGSVYSLDEIVIDVNALIRELVKPNQDVVYKIDQLTKDQLEFDNEGKLNAIIIEAPLGVVRIQAQRFIFTAGNGNAILQNTFSQNAFKMQKRPLHMVVAKTDFNYSLYGHCLGLGSTPRVTITTHHANDGKIIWYLGGQLAEEGVKRSATEQIKMAHKELTELFPWLDFSNVKYATFVIDRAEAMQADGKRPDTCTVNEYKNIIAAWPTKLAFAPKLANDIVNNLNKANVTPKLADMRALRILPFPCLVKPIWDQLL